MAHDLAILNGIRVAGIAAHRFGGDRSMDDRVATLSGVA